jgi:hypothetical protein
MAMGEPRFQFVRKRDRVLMRPAKGFDRASGAGRAVDCASGDCRNSDGRTFRRRDDSVSMMRQDGGFAQLYGLPDLSQVMLAKNVEVSSK